MENNGEQILAYEQRKLCVSWVCNRFSHGVGGKGVVDEIDVQRQVKNGLEYIWKLYKKERRIIESLWTESTIMTIRELLWMNFY